MKRLVLVFLFGVFVLSSTVVYAAEKAPLGNSNIALKLGYINFTDEVLENVDLDSGLYVGIAGSAKITPNLYLGMEVGYSNPEGSVFGIDTELTFITVELMNLKYVIEPSPQMVIDFGAGVSSNYVKEKVSAWGSSATVDDWLFGGQFFIDLIYTSDKFFFGMNWKYQYTEDFKDGSYNYNNWRIGGQAGFMF